MPAKRPTILLSPSGRRVELWRLFEQAIAGLGLDWRVMGTDIEPHSSTSLACGEIAVVPRATSPAFLPAVREIVDRHDVRLIIPTIDPELPLYASSDVGTMVMISSRETVTLTTDKLATHGWALSSGIASPRTWRPDDATALTGARFVVKPRYGSASEGVRLSLSPADVDALLATVLGRDLVVQEHVHGPEYTVNCFVTRSGRCVAAIPHRRIRTRGGEVSRGLTERHDAIEEAARKAMASLPGAYGALCVQFIDDPSRGPQLIEVNARFGGGYPLAHRAGARFPERLVREAAGLPEPEGESDSWEAGWEMFRYDQSAFVRRVAEDTRSP
jgi:carbamoyl-phosphate synthase large subunit